MPEQALGEIDANARRKTRGVNKGCITPSYKSSSGGIVVYDDGDIEEDMTKEREAYCALVEMPEVDEEDEEDLGDDSGSEGEVDQPSSSDSRKRKSWSRTDDEDESDEEDGPPRQRRRSNSVCSTWGGQSLNCGTNVACRGPRLLLPQLANGPERMIPSIRHALSHQY